MRNILVGALIAAFGLVGGGLVSSNAEVTSNNHYYVTVNRCDMPRFTYTNQPERSLRTLASAQQRAYDLLSNPDVSSARVTDANTGDIVAYVESINC